MGQQTGPEGQPGGFPGGMQIGNNLKTRFLESDAFTAVYEDAYWDLFEQMYGSGRALELLDNLASTVPVTDGLTAESLQTSIDTTRSWIDERTTTLDNLRNG